MTLALLLTAVGGAWAQTQWESGDCTVTLNNGTLTVEAEGPACGVLRLCGEAGADLVKQTRDLVPARVNFACQAPPEETAGLLKSALFGSSLSLIVKDGEILFGGRILFAEYDGPRDRRYAVCVQGEV